MLAIKVVFDPESIKRSSIKDKTQFWPFFDPRSSIVTLFITEALVLLSQNPPKGRDVIYGRPPRYNCLCVCAHMLEVISEQLINLMHYWNNRVIKDTFIKTLWQRRQAVRSCRENRKIGYRLTSFLSIYCVCLGSWPSQSEEHASANANAHPIIHARALILCSCLNILSY